MKELEEAATVEAPRERENILASIQEVLEYYDLGTVQIRVYLHLAKSGSQPVTAIAKKVGVHRTEIYKTLKELEALGLAAGSLDSPRRYSAVGFREAVRMLWEERRRVLDAVGLMSEALAREFDRIPATPAEAEAPSQFIRVWKRGKKDSYWMFRKRVELYISGSLRQFHYLEESIARYLGPMVDGIVSNTGHPELGSFIVLDEAVLLFRAEDGEYSIIEIRIPEIVAAYAELYQLLEAEA